MKQPNNKKKSDSYFQDKFGKKTNKKVSSKKKDDELTYRDYLELKKEDAQTEKTKKAAAKKTFKKKSVTDFEKQDNPSPQNHKPRKYSNEEKMPLNKYIAHCGICSRRDAVTLIKNGEISVNGKPELNPGYKIQQGDKITHNGQYISVQKSLVYILMNKPKGFITTTEDPKGRRTVMDIVSNHVEQRVYPIGRLDRNTTGLLLLTNDGDLSQKLAHPKYDIRKLYHAVLDKKLSQADFDKIASGLVLEDGPVQVDDIAYLESKTEIGIAIHSGKNRIVRRIFESLGYVVEKLDRVMYAGLTKKNIPRGKWRMLTPQEVINLKHLAPKGKGDR